jgi:hypothetical protein
MSFDQSHYFFVLHQIEIDLEVDHDFLLETTRRDLDKLLQLWFDQRAKATGVKRPASEDFKQGLFNWKEVERELESE